MDNRIVLQFIILFFLIVFITKSDQQVNLKIIMIISGVGHILSLGLSNEVLKFYTVLEIVLRQYRSTIRRQLNFAFWLLNLSWHQYGLVASHVNPCQDT